MNIKLKKKIIKIQMKKILFKNKILIIILIIIFLKIDKNEIIKIKKMYKF